MVGGCVIFMLMGRRFFFLAVYLHMARGVYYGSFIYPRHMV